MRFGRIYALALAAALAVTGSSHAQVSKNLNEFSVDASFTGTKVEGGDDTDSRINLHGMYGRFLTDHFEVGPILGVTKIEDVDAFGSFGGFAAWHFGGTESMTVPYIQGAIGSTFGQENILGDSINALLWGFEGGIKWFPGQNGAVRIAGFFEQERYDEDETGFSWINRYGVRIGISLFCGGSK